LVRAMHPSDRQSSELAERRALIVEDQYLVAVDLAHSLRSLGIADIQMTASADSALTLLDREDFDLAFLDINLGETSVYPVADELARRDIPFAFVSGHTRTVLPARHSRRPHFEKPFMPMALRHLVADWTAVRAGGS
jgi:CheY-like chemotaxis protein